MAERESLSRQNTFFEGVGKGGQISFPASGCSRGSKATQISVVYRFIPVCNFGTLTRVLKARRVGTKFVVVIM